MPRIVRNKQILHAEQLDRAIEAPGPDGVTQLIARVGDWVCYTETEEGGFLFKTFLSEQEYREKHSRIGGDAAMRQQRLAV